MREQIEPLLQLPFGDQTPREQVCEAFSAEAEKASKLTHRASSCQSDPECRTANKTENGEFITHALDLNKLTRSARTSHVVSGKHVSHNVMRFPVDDAVINQNCSCRSLLPEQRCQPLRPNLDPWLCLTKLLNLESGSPITSTTASAPLTLLARCH